MAFFKLFNIVLILGMLVGILWFVKVKLKQHGRSLIRSSGHIDVVDEGVQMGMNHKVVIIRVGDELFLHAYGTNGVTFQKLDQTALVNRSEQFMDTLEETAEIAGYEGSGSVSFKDILRVRKERKGKSS